MDFVESIKSSIERLKGQPLDKIEYERRCFDEIRQRKSLSGTIKDYSVKRYIQLNRPNSIDISITCVDDDNEEFEFTCMLNEYIYFGRNSILDREWGVSIITEGHGEEERLLIVKHNPDRKG